MPARSKVAMLPEGVRAELDRRIVARAFGGYHDLAEWLQAQGYHIAYDSIRRHGSKLAHKLEARERLADEVRALGLSAQIADGTLLQVTIQLIHDRVLSLLLQAPEENHESLEPDDRAAEADGGAPAPPSDSCQQLLTLSDLTRMTRIVAALSRITLPQLPAEQNGSPPGEDPGNEPPAKPKGLSDAAYNAIRNILLGIKRGSERSEETASAEVPACGPHPQGDQIPHETPRTPVLREPPPEGKSGS